MSELDTLRKIFEAYRRDYISTSRAIGEVKKWALELVGKEKPIKDYYATDVKLVIIHGNNIISEIRKNIEESK